MKEKNTKKASVLAFTLIMLSILLLAGLSLMGSVTVDQRASIDTRKSVQALQSAESGSDIMVSKIKKNMSGTISSLGACEAPGVISGSSSQGTYAVSFLKEDGSTLDCGDKVEDIAKVTSTGTYAQTNRAVEVSLAVEQFGERAKVLAKSSNGDCNTANIKNAVKNEIPLYFKCGTSSDSVMGRDITIYRTSSSSVSFSPPTLWGVSTPTYFCYGASGKFRSESDIDVCPFGWAIYGTSYGDTSGINW